MVFFSITSGFEVKFRKKKLRYNKWDRFYLFNSSVLCKTICCLSEILFTFFLLTKILIFLEEMLLIKYTPLPIHSRNPGSLCNGFE